MQPLLNGVLSYLPCPTEVSNYALDQMKDEEKVLYLTDNMSQYLFKIIGWGIQFAWSLCRLC